MKKEEENKEMENELKTYFLEEDEYFLYNLIKNKYDIDSVERFKEKERIFIKYRNMIIKMWRDINSKKSIIEMLNKCDKKMIKYMDSLLTRLYEVICDNGDFGTFSKDFSKNMELFKINFDVAIGEEELGRKFDEIKLNIEKGSKILVECYKLLFYLHEKGIISLNYE